MNFYLILMRWIKRWNYIAAASISWLLLLRVYFDKLEMALIYRWSSYFWFRRSHWILIWSETWFGFQLCCRSNPSSSSSCRWRSRSWRYYWLNQWLFSSCLRREQVRHRLTWWMCSTEILKWRCKIVAIIDGIQIRWRYLFIARTNLITLKLVWTSRVHSQTLSSVTQLSLLLNLLLLKLFV